MSQPVITLTTDFGQADGYVGTMKGVILGICPQASLVDISHKIRPQGIRQAAYVLHTATPYFPPGTIHLVVVDPGVGSARRPIAVQTQRAIYVVPDNGVLSLVLAQDPAQQAIHLTEQRFRLPLVSTTFHGRDIFSPAAAYLACGVDPQEMGAEIPISELVTISITQPQIQAAGTWQGEILNVDHFGNLITNFRFPMADAASSAPRMQISILAGGKQITGLSSTFADVEPGELVVYVGSDGYLEIAVREGNAAAVLKLDVGDPVQVIGYVPFAGDAAKEPGPSMSGKALAGG
jgi:S-adenosylmethionine hydrolase